MTGCGCLLVVAVLGVLLYFFTFGATDAGEQVEQAVALTAVGYVLAMAGWRAVHSVARS